MVKKLIAVLLVCSLLIGRFPPTQAKAYSIIPNYGICEIGDIGDMYFGNHYGSFESTRWSSSDSSIIDIIDTSRLGYCTIECLKPGKVSIYLSYHYSLQEPEVIGTSVYWYWVEYVSNFTYTVTVRSPQCILTNTSATSNTASFSFDAPTGASSVVLQQSSDGGSTWKTATTAALNSGSTSATSSGLTPITTYQYKIHVVGGKRDGDSNIVTVTTGALVSGVTLDNTRLTIVRGLTGTLSATVLPSNAGNKKVNWSSGDTSLATVTNNNNGTATITANETQTGNVNITSTTEESGYSKSCLVTIINPTMVPPVPSVPAGIINIGTKVSLSVPVPNPTIFYTLDGSTPSRSSTKYVSPIEITNSCTLKAFAISSDMLDSSVLSVAYTAVVGVTGVTFKNPSISLPIGNTVLPLINVLPSTAYNKAVTYSSGDTSIFTVESNGIITGNALGSAELTITTVDGGFTATCIVTVTPKPIYSGADFAKIGVNPNYLSSYPYELKNDISVADCSHIQGFSGIFDGGGHCISGVSGNPLFYENTGTIKNLYMSGTIVSNTGITNSFSDTVGGLAQINTGSITNCTNEVSVVNSCNENYGYFCTGGFVGDNRGTIEYCVNKGKVSGVCNLGEQTEITGGIVGSNSGTVRYCSNSGEINGNDYSGSSYNYFSLISETGGIVGSGGQVISCFNTGKVSAKSSVRYGSLTFRGAYAYSYAGGISGGYCNAENCYNSGAVTAYSCIYPSGTGSTIYYHSEAYAGGICGYDEEGGTELCCYNSGAVSSSATGNYCTPISSKLGIGLAATNSYCLNNVSDGGGSATIVSDAQLKEQSTYSGFDFDSVWAIDARVNNGYPYLINNAIVPLIPPIDIVAPSKTDTSVTLSWKAAVGAKAYNVYNGSIKLTDIPITRTSFTVTGLTEKTTYSFTVKAVNGAEESTASVPFSVTTNATPTVTLPPTGFALQGKTSTTVDLSWIAVEGSTGYNVYNGSTKLTDTPIATTSYTVNGLTSNTEYHFSVKAVNEVGESLPSEVLSVTTKKAGGDVNGDTQVDLVDVTVLSRFVAGWTGIQVDEGALDVNADGNVDLIDVTFLSRYVAGWNVILN